jgi:hypothetical protein
MARTEAQVITDLTAAVESIDRTIDVRKGPFRNTYILPFSDEIINAEESVEDLAQRYSTAYVSTLDSASIDIYGENHGIARGEGEVSRGYVYFYTYTPPQSGDSFLVPQGTVVTDRDGLLAYQTTFQVQILGSRASSYYNPSKRWYEVRASVEALAAGDIYDIPPGRIRRIISDLPDFSGVDQRSRVEGGAQIETNEDYMERIDSALHGSALGSIGGIESTVRNFNPSAITDVAIVYSIDTGLFTRPTSRPSMDIYVIGEVPLTYEQTYTAGGGETDVSLSRVPVLSITSVLVNNVTVTDYELVLDETLQTGTSAQADDFIRFPAPLAANDEVVITYTYNSLIRDLQVYLSQPRVYLFETEFLVRSGIPVGIEIVVFITLLSTYDPQLAESAAISAVTNYASPGKFRELSYADDMRIAITSEIPYATQVLVTTFKRTDFGILEVEVIELQKNQYPFTDSTLYTINVESTL